MVCCEFYVFLCLHFSIKANQACLFSSLPLGQITDSPSIFLFANDEESFPASWYQFRALHWASLNLMTRINREDFSLHETRMFCQQVEENFTMFVFEQVFFFSCFT